MDDATKAGPQAVQEAIQRARKKPCPVCTMTGKPRQVIERIMKGSLRAAAKAYPELPYKAMAAHSKGTCNGPNGVPRVGAGAPASPESSGPDEAPDEERMSAGEGTQGGPSEPRVVTAEDDVVDQMRDVVRQLKRVNVDQLTDSAKVNHYNALRQAIMNLAALKPPVVDRKVTVADVDGLPELLGDMFKALEPFPEARRALSDVFRKHGVFG